MFTHLRPKSKKDIYAAIEKLSLNEIEQMLQHGEFLPYATPSLEEEERLHQLKERLHQLKKHYKHKTGATWKCTHVNISSISSELFGRWCYDCGRFITGKEYEHIRSSWITNNQKRCSPT